MLLLLFFSQARSRLNLSFETLFSAANCFDRFVHVIGCGVSIRIIDMLNSCIELVEVNGENNINKLIISGME